MHRAVLINALVRHAPSHACVRACVCLRAMRQCQLSQLLLQEALCLMHTFIFQTCSEHVICGPSASSGTTQKRGRPRPRWLPSLGGSCIDAGTFLFDNARPQYPFCVLVCLTGRGGRSSGGYMPTRDHVLGGEHPLYEPPSSLAQPSCEFPAGLAQALYTLYKLVQASY